MTSLDKFKKLRVAVGIPSGFFWMTDFAISYTNLVLFFAQNRMPGYSDQVLQTINSKGSILPKQRMEVVKKALEMKATHLLWLDSDHVFPPQMLHRLLSHDLDVVCVNHVTKSIPASPTARAKPTKPSDPSYGVPIFTDDNSPELEKVWRIGTGTMLMTRKVLDAIGHKVFDMYYRPEVDSYQGEDWTMCEHIEKAGFEMWIDHPLSLQCEHIGVLNYNHSLVPGTKLIDDPKPAPKLEIARG